MEKSMNYGKSSEIWFLSDIIFIQNLGFHLDLDLGPW